MPEVIKDFNLNYSDTVPGAGENGESGTIRSFLLAGIG